jgi:hypothetical protein
MTTDWKSARTTTPQLLQVARTSKMELEAMLHNETFDMKWRKVTNILHLPNENRTLISRHSGYALPTLQEEPPDIQDTFPPCNTHPHHTNHHLPMKFKPQHGPTAPSKTSGGPPHTMPELQRHPTRIHQSVPPWQYDRENKNVRTPRSDRVHICHETECWNHSAD